MKDPHALVETYYDLGGVLQNRGRHQDAMVAFRRSMELAQSAMDDIGLGLALYGIGRVYSSLIDHHQAIKYKKEALEVIERTGDVDNIAKICIGLGTSLAEVHNYSGRSNITSGRLAAPREPGAAGYALRNAVVVWRSTCWNGSRAYQPSEQDIQKLGTMLLADLHLMRGYIFNKRMEWVPSRVHRCMKPSRRRAPLLGRWLYE